MSTVTVATLVYQKVSWIDFLLEGLYQARNTTDFSVVIVANDPTPEVRQDPRVTHILDHPDCTEHYMARVYDAWNYAMLAAPTETVVLISSDMYVSDYWLDALLEAPPEMLAASVLVESGRLPSAMPEYVLDLGCTPQTFNRARWKLHSAELRAHGAGLYEPGRLYGPVRLHKESFFRAGGYPRGNINNVPGDKLLFSQLQHLGYTHTTCLGSVVYHVQEGEMRDP